MKNILVLLLFGLVFFQSGYSQKNIRNFPVKVTNPNDSIPIIYNGSEWIIQPKTFPTWSNSNDTVTSDRVIYLDSNSFCMKSDSVGFYINSIFNGLGFPARFSGFTSNSNGVYSLNGLLLGHPAQPDLWFPVQIQLEGNPFEGEGEFVFSGIFNGGYEFSKTTNGIAAGMYYDEIGINLLNDEGDNVVLSNDGKIIHNGAYVNTSIEIFEDSGNDTIGNNVRLYIYNPDTVQNDITIYLPDNPQDGQYITIVGGGTIQSGNVATSSSVKDYNGFSPIGWANNDLQAGPIGSFVWVESAGKWYQITY